jgi:hypothetical protein
MIKDYAIKFKTFFGIEMPHNKVTAFITNINPIYEAIISLSNEASENVGFYKSSLLLIDKNRYFLVKISSGNVIIDVIRLLADVCDRILLFGIAGSIDEQYKIGAVVTPAIFNKNNCPSIALRSSGVSLEQTSGLIQEDHYYHELIAKGVSLIDMESYDFAFECQRLDVPYKIVLQVSDQPLTIPFYQADNPGISINRILYMGDIVT